MKIAQNFCLFFSFYFFCSFGWTMNSLTQKYPDILLTDDHGILGENDVNFDQEVEPYAIERDQPGFSRWQCFPVSDVKPKIQKWRGVDGLGSSKIVTMCDLHIVVEVKEPWHDYFEPRAWNNNHCRDFMKAWTRLTKKESFVCFSGRPFLLEKENIKGIERTIKFWQWDKFKTKKGSYSYY